MTEDEKNPGCSAAGIFCSALVAYDDCGAAETERSVRALEEMLSANLPQSPRDPHLIDPCAQRGTEKRVMAGGAGSLASPTTDAGGPWPRQRLGTTQQQQDAKHQREKPSSPTDATAQLEAPGPRRR